MTSEAARDRGRWLLALHSSSDTLGVGLQRLGASEPPLLAAFPLGRALSNRLIECIETVLPARRWPELGRLAVATGPGGFTGTRLGVAFARTLAQQQALPLDGISSFHLMARRIALTEAREWVSPFRLVQELPRRGVVTGLYAADPAAPAGMAELEPPRLFRSLEQLPPPEYPRFPAQPSLPEDAAELLAFGQAAAAGAEPSPWQAVLPIYPTSPVQAADG